mgnify:CR=1 FL=1
MLGAGSLAIARAVFHLRWRRPSIAVLRLPLRFSSPSSPPSCDARRQPLHRPAAGVWDPDAPRCCPSSCRFSPIIAGNFHGSGSTGVEAAVVCAGLSGCCATSRFAFGARCWPSASSTASSPSTRLALRPHRARRRHAVAQGHVQKSGLGRAAPPAALVWLILDDTKMPEREPRCSYRGCTSRWVSASCLSRAGDGLRPRPVSWPLIVRPVLTGGARIAARPVRCAVRPSLGRWSSRLAGRRLRPPHAGQSSPGCGCVTAAIARRSAAASLALDRRLHAGRLHRDRCGFSSPIIRYFSLAVLLSHRRLRGVRRVRADQRGCAGR